MKIRDLNGQRALITGGTSGIGRATAHALAREGARVLISGRSEERGAEVIAAIKASGGEAEFVRANLESAGEVRALAERAAEVEILVNNAGVFPAGATHELSEAAFDETFAVNVKAPFLLTAAIAPKMVARGGGAIINVTRWARVLQPSSRPFHLAGRPTPKRSRRRSSSSPPAKRAT